MTITNLPFYFAEIDESSLRSKLKNTAISIDFIKINERNVDDLILLASSDFIVDIAVTALHNSPISLVDLPANAIVVYSHIAQLETSFGLLSSKGIRCFHWPIQSELLDQHLQQKYTDQAISKERFALKTLQGFGDLFMHIDPKGFVLDILKTNKPELTTIESDSRGKLWYHVLNINTELSSNDVMQFINMALRTPAMTRLNPFAINAPDGGCYLVDGLITPTQLDGGSEGVTLTIRQLARLDSLLSERQLGLSADASLSAILVLSPDSLNDINSRFGRQYGDRFLKQISKTLRDIVPSTELSNHFGGATFVVLFKHSSTSQAENISTHLFNALKQLSVDGNPSGATFSFGLAVNQGERSRTLIELFHQACHAMVTAQRLGGQQLSIAQSHLALQQVGDLDKLSGNLSHNATNDYLSLIMSYSILSNELDSVSGDEFINALLKKLVIGLSLTSAAFAHVKTGQAQQAIIFSANSEENILAKLQLTESQRQILIQNDKTQDPKRIFTSISEQQDHEILLPILERGSVTGVLLLKVENQYAVKAKNHLLLENICEYLRIKLRHNTGTNQPKVALSHSPHSDLLYQSAQMKTLVQLLETVAPTDATVLITGESGTGKELLAQSIHKRSKRSDKPFVVFDCGSVVDNLLDSELFGHVKGAFTGAQHTKSGAISAAEGGTLFLDEVGELPIDTQAKLLRFVQERQYSLVGERKLKTANVRVVAATNVDLEQHMKEGKFREDLYYRLNVFNLQSLPLRDRPEDILPIGRHFLQKFCSQYDKEIVDFSQLAQRAMSEYSWKGNVRELVNLVHRAVVICQSSEIEAKDLGLYPNMPPPTASSIIECAATSNSALTSINAIETDTASIWQAYLQHTSIINAELNALDMLEASLLQDALRQNDGVILKAAGYLGIAETTFRRKWQKIAKINQVTDPDLTAYLTPLIQAVNDRSRALNGLDKVKTELVKAAAQLNLPISLGAPLLGMSPPTYRKILNKQ